MRILLGKHVCFYLSLALSLWAVLTLTVLFRIDPELQVADSLHVLTIVALFPMAGALLVAYVGSLLLD